MAIRTIRLKNDPILRKISKEVTEIDDKTIQLLDDMRETMEVAEGVGLAAVQVGVLKRIFIACFDEDEVTECINPVIVKQEGFQIGNEGCLSIPNASGFCKRPKVVTLEYTDRTGARFLTELEDFEAVICMHEFDHLDGILYDDNLLSDEELDNYNVQYKSVEQFNDKLDEVLSERNLVDNDEVINN